MLKSMRFTFKPSNQMVNATMKKKIKNQGIKYLEN